MAKAPFMAEVVFNPRPPCGGRWVVHLHASFDFLVDSKKISAAATSNANKMLTTARFIVGSSFPECGCISLDQVNPSGFSLLTLKYREKGKMRAGRHVHVASFFPVAGH